MNGEKCFKMGIAIEGMKNNINIYIIRDYFVGYWIPSIFYLHHKTQKLNWLVWNFAKSNTEA